MMTWIVSSSLRARRAVVAAAVVLMAVGVWQLRNAEVDVLPEFAPPTVEVQTEALGLSAEEVEQLITVPIEQDLLDGVAWLDTIRSRSVPGLSSVELVFEQGTDLYRARQVVQERISQAAGLPNVSRPPQMLQPQSSTSRTAMVALSSKELSAIQIGVLARWTIRPQLLAVPGVANVAIWGQRERQLQVQVDPAKLRDRAVSLQQVISSTGNALWVSPLTFLEASTPGTGGFIDTPQQRLGIQHNLPIITPADLAGIPIEDTAGPTLTLGDVATVVEDHQPLIGDAIVEGADGSEGAGFLLVIDKLPGANTTEVTQAVEQALDELRPGLSGLEMSSSLFRPATYVDAAVDHLTRSVLLGVLALVVVLGACLLSWRRALVALGAIGLSFTAGLLVVHLAGNTINIVVFAGLVMAVAAVIADAIASVDNAGQQLGRSGDSAADVTGRARIVRDATLQTGWTVAWATAVFVMALVPVFLMDGLSGDSFFPPAALTSVLVLVVSLLVALSVTPALSLLLSRSGPTGNAPLARWLRRSYERVGRHNARMAIPACVVAAALVVATALVIPRLDKALLPGLKDTNVLIELSAPFGTSLAEMDRITARASNELRTLPGVVEVGAHVGQAVRGDQPVGSDAAEIWVNIDPAANHDATMAGLRHTIAGYPGLDHKVITYSQDRMDHVLATTSDEITVRIFGNDLDVLYQKADEVKALLAATRGISGEHMTSRQAEPTIEVEVDLARARTAGIKPGDVRRAAATLLSGVRVGNLFEKQKVFDVMVWSTPETRRSVSDVEDLLLDTPAGDTVRLGDVAAVRVRPTVPVIQHEDISRFVDVSAEVSGRDVGAVTARVQRGLEQVDFPLEYHAQLLHDYTRQQDAQRRLWWIAIAAAAGVFLLLQAAFASWRVAFLIFVLLPVALSGGVLAAWIAGDDLTLATVAGLLGVLAVSVRWSVALAKRYAELRADGLAFGDGIVEQATGEQVTAIVMTLLATSAMLAPALLFGDIAGQELLRPMAVVIVSGLVTSALVNLLVLPALYVRFGPRRESGGLDLETELEEAERELAVVKVGVGEPGEEPA